MINSSNISASSCVHSILSGAAEITGVGGGDDGVSIATGGVGVVRTDIALGVVTAIGTNSGAVAGHGAKR